MLLKWCKNCYTYSVCIFLCTIQRCIQSYKSYTLPYVSKMVNDEDCNIYELTSMVTTIPVHNYCSDRPTFVSINGTWGTNFTSLNDDIVFDDTGLVTILSSQLITYILSLFSNIMFGKLVMIINTNKILTLSTTPTQLPQNITSIVLIYNINPILWPFLKPSLNITFDKLREKISINGEKKNL
jgi:hypothetical protein